MIICIYNYVWTTYNDFDKPVDDIGGKYFSLCNIILQSIHVEGSENNDFCMKLMRNLGYFSDDKLIYAPTFERCNILNNWIHNYKNKKKITVDFINKCFSVYTEHMSDRGNNKICHIDAYDDIFNERIYRTLLHIFETKVNIIKDKLNGQDQEAKIPCRKFLCDCLKIYHYMNESFCHNRGYLREQHRDTCLKLSQFESTYNLLRSGIISTNDQIPALGGKDNECFERKPSAQLKTLLNLTDQQVPRYNLGEDSAEPDEGLDGPRGEKFSKPHGNEDSPMRKTITTTIGTFAGASSLLALLYRVNTKFY
ncbi:hypothetical protein PVBG_04753 [Plasmodium vivax Brazil I]|uniref:Uncharacterized protein n=1 Tax=Plasmodium vivax (strain Brazil I) TaxID=1033975 RepID=A0A0J9T099_PLAV1|nr:hypothetical protein PVBG_04753 [Plasmodium vivax Brazil I]